MVAYFLSLLHALTVIQSVLQQSVTHFSVPANKLGKGMRCCFMVRYGAPSLSFCAKECFYLKRCNSFTYDKKESSCYIHGVNSTNVKEQDWIKSTSLIFADRTDWPKAIAGSCADNPCQIREKCIPRQPPLCTAFCGIAYSSGSVGVYGGCTTFGCVRETVCRKGFSRTSTDMTITCQENGMWSGLPQCIRKADCGSPPEVANATVGPGLETENANRTYECKDPYTANTTLTWIICQTSSNWTTPAFECN